MKIRTIGYSVFIAATAIAFAIGSSGPGQAKQKKKAEAAPPEAVCWMSHGPVCATKGGMSFTYASSCYAERDGAKVVSNKACAAKKAMKAHKKAAKKKMAKEKKKM